jgi:hypothetical protein
MMVNLAESSMFQRNITPPSSQSKNKPSKKQAEAGGKLSSTFLQNVELSSSYTAIQPR